MKRGNSTDDGKGDDSFLTHIYNIFSKEYLKICLIITCMKLDVNWNGSNNKNYIMRDENKK